MQADIARFLDQTVERGPVYAQSGFDLADLSEQCGLARDMVLQVGDRIAGRG